MNTWQKSFSALCAFKKSCTRSKPNERENTKGTLVEGMVSASKFSDMRVENSSQPIPKGWELVVETKNGSESLSYVCPESKQTFNTYEMLMRYVEYAKAAKLSIYSPNFDTIKRIWKTKKFKKQNFPGKTKLQSVYPCNLPGKTIPRPLSHQGNKISKLEKSPEDGEPALRMEESFDARELLKKDFRFTYFRRRWRN